MLSYTSKLVKHGEYSVGLTLPAAICKALNVKAGDSVLINLTELSKCTLVKGIPKQTDDIDLG